MRTNELVNKIKEQLTDVFDEREAYNIARILLEDNHRIKRSDLLLNTDVSVDEHRLGTELDRLMRGEPIQYVTGVADFYGRTFEIEKGTLIPRPETEELVRLIVQRHATTPSRIWDIGTGSGCIAISLALEIETDILATDVSETTLRTAKKNGENLRIGAGVRWVKQVITQP